MRAATIDDYINNDIGNDYGKRPNLPLTDEVPMSPWKILGLAALGVGVLAAAVGGAIWWWRKRKDANEITPSKPPRVVPTPDGKSTPEPERAKNPAHQFVGTAELDPELREMLETTFTGAWPPDTETIDNLTQDDMIVFAVEGVATGNYTETRQELINAQVLSVEASIVRARVKGPVLYAAHFGSHPGHGLEVGESVEVPRSKVLVAARQKHEGPQPTGYDSEGKAVAQFKPTTMTTKVHSVKPGTPYDLVLPYRTDTLVWQVQAKNHLVDMIRIGQRAALEQIKFTEASLRGPFSVVVMNDDPKLGYVFVARWDFDLQA
ncbi:hypothetical protein ACNOYE_07970 [Nannocystaceae bacterium ST9]